MHTSPRVSVVMAAHNTERFIAQAVTSVLIQDIGDLELILIDDGSTDDTMREAARVSDARVVVLSNPSAGGPARARNQGIMAANAPYVAIFDSDDVMSPGSLSSACRALDCAPSALIAFADLRRIDLDNNLLEPSVLARYAAFHSLPRRELAAGWSLVARENFARGLLYENFVFTSSVVMRTAAVREAGAFDESLFNSEDRDLWFRLAKRGDAVCSDRIAYSYRLNPKSISHGPEERNSLNRIEVLRRERTHWSDRGALAQIDRLIAANLVSMGHWRRRQGRRAGAARCFAQALFTRPSWGALRSLAGCLR